MPCDNVAVARAQITANVAAEILASDTTVEVLRAFVAEKLGTRVTSRTVQTRLHGNPGPAFESVWLEAFDDGITVTISNGRISVQGGNRAAVRQLTQQIEAFAPELARLLATDRTVMALRQRYVVKSDTRTTGGARVVRLMI